jgi:hypothetical protein
MTGQSATVSADSHIRPHGRKPLMSSPEPKRTGSAFAAVSKYFVLYSLALI